MKGSPPSSGRRTTASRNSVRPKPSAKVAASTAKGQAKTSAKPSPNRDPRKSAAAAAVARGKPPQKSPAAVKAVTGRIASIANDRNQKKKNAATHKAQPTKPGIAKAVVAKSAPVGPTAKPQQAAVEVKSGVKMKANPAGANSPKSAKTAPPSGNAKVVPANIVLPENYRPSDAEPFMSPLQRHYFRMKLLNWKEEILRQTRETLQGMHDETVQYADLADRATSETDRALELRARDRQRKLISKIDAALSRIEDGTYGYCEETGEPIGLKRLDARPIATLSLEAQERHERREKVHRGD